MNKTFNTILLVIFFCMGSFGFYKWITSKLIPETDIVPTKGRIVEVTYGGDDNKDIIIRLDKGPELFRFLERFPNYKNAHLELEVDSVLCVWHKPQQSKMYTIYRLDVRDETILSYADVARSYETDSWNVLKVSATFSVAFIVALALRLHDERKMRTNQRLKPTG